MEPKIAVILLAAGMATRMGPAGGHKLLAKFAGVPLVRRSALAALNSDAQSVTVVVGYRQDEIRDALSGLALNVVSNPDYATGMASSLAAGVAFIENSKPDGILIMLADMPMLTSDDLNRVMTAFRDLGGDLIVRAVSQGRPRNPVILPGSMSDAVRGLQGDVGARHLIETCGLSVFDLELGEAAQVDVDTVGAVIAAGGTPEN